MRKAAPYFWTSCIPSSGTSSVNFRELLIQTRLISSLHSDPHALCANGHGEDQLNDLYSGIGVPDVGHMLKWHQRDLAIRHACGSYDPCIATSRLTILVKSLRQLWCSAYLQLAGFDGLTTSPKMQPLLYVVFPWYVSCCFIWQIAALSWLFWQQAITVYPEINHLTSCKRHHFLLKTRGNIFRVFLRDK